MVQFLHQHPAITDAGTAQSPQVNVPMATTQRKALHMASRHAELLQLNPSSPTPNAATTRQCIGSFFPAQYKLRVNRSILYTLDTLEEMPSFVA